MSRKNLVIFLAVLSIAMLAMAACGGPQGEAGPAGPAGETGPAGPAGADGADAVFDISAVTCVECHNDTALITGKQTQWAMSVHGSGTAYDYAGGRDSCANCHSGAAFSVAVVEGTTPDEGHAVEVTRQDCRTCHQIHTTYTGEDWALETTAAVNLYAFEGVTYDGGEGNLCVNCHQPRRGFDGYVAEDGTVTGVSGHWGPHHGPQSAMILGIAGAGLEGSASPHYNVENTCVTCHMGEGADHTWEVQDGACVECHGEDFDYEEAQAEAQALLDELGDKLVAAGLLTSNDADGHYTGSSSDILDGDLAAALWNWIYIAHEDKSVGAHNMSYTIDLLEYSLSLLP